MRYNDNESINKINKYINYKYTHRPTIKSLEHNHPIRTIQILTIKQMRTTFLQKFNQQQHIEEQISKKMGYTVTPSSLNQSKVSVVTQKSFCINRNFRPRQIKSIQTKMSPQHINLIKQIAQTQYEKKMKKKFIEKQKNSDSSNNNAEFNVIKLLNQRIKQYNYLIDHKHIIEKNSEDTKRVLKLKPKSQAQMIIQQINKKNRELLKAEDIMKQFQINKSIAGLYRQYKEKMEQETKRNSLKNSNELNLNTLPLSNQSIKLRATKINDLNKNRNEKRNRIYSECTTNNGRFRIINSTNQQYKTAKASAKNIMGQQLNIKQPYISEEQIKKANQVQRKLENNRELLDMYKSKVTQYTNFREQVIKSEIQKKMRKLSGSKSKSKSKVDTRRIQDMQIDTSRQQIVNPFTANNSIRQIQKGQKINEVHIGEVRQKKKMQQKFFSTYLQKRNRKFKKPWGNKILIKYDSNSQAKQMLGRSPKNPNKTQNSYYTNMDQNKTSQSFMKSASPKATSFRIIPKNISDEDKVIYDSMMQQENDTKHYDMTCKNQKINLFLKAKKRNKE